MLESCFCLCESILMLSHDAIRFVWYAETKKLKLGSKTILTLDLEVFTRMAHFIFVSVVMIFFTHLDWKLVWVLGLYLTVSSESFQFASF